MVSLITALGAMALVGGGLTYFTFPIGLEFGIKTMVNLNENGMVFPLYMKPPFLSDSVYRIYEITNPREVLNGGKMKLNIKGPYIYKAGLQRENIAFMKSGDVVHYDSSRKLYLDEARSANMDEKFWMLNPIVPGVLKTVRSMVIDRVPFQRVTEPVVFNAVNVLLDNFNERLIAKTSARELLEGRKIQLLESLTSLADRFGLKTLVPPGPPENTFGLAFVQNLTIDTMEIWTGSESKEKFADVFKWQGKQKMTFWSGKCNIINGTNGELFKPLINKEKPIKVFLAPLCRTFYMEPLGEVVLPNGAEALEFEFSPRLYMGARSLPSNKCFCVDKRTYDCQYDGLLAMGPCFFDSPIYFSRGNFKGVDRRIRSLVDDSAIETTLPEKQSFYLDSTTGTLLMANLSLLAVFKVVRQPYMRDLARVQNLTYAPLFTVNEVVVVPDELVWQVRLLQVVKKYYRQGAIGIALGGLVILLMRFMFRGRRPAKAESGAQS